MILIFVSSLNMNMTLAETFHAQLKALGKDSEIINLVELQLPMYDTDKEEKEGIPKGIHALIEKMQTAEGYLFVSPEYNYLVPPVLVNFIAWVSRIGDDFRELFSMKLIQLSSHSGGGGMNVTHAMRTQFTGLGSLVMPREIIATYQSPLREESSEKILKQFVGLIDKG